MPFGPLVNGAWLRRHLGEPDLAVVDLRWYLGRPGDGAVAYERGHIPGAMFCDLEGTITGREGPGRHPLPTREGFETAMRELGVNKGDRVVGYDDAGGSTAARLWFLLRLFGHPAVAVLDGGLQAWPGELESGSVARPGGDFEAAEPDRTRILSYEDVAARHDGVLLDARAHERYLGLVEPTGVRAGHIPGARSAYWEGNLRPDRRFKSPEELRRRYAELGAEGGNTVVYCGSGVTSCHTLLALEIAGLPGARLYEGSWSDWAPREAAAVATGEEG